jgi:hypothetical protein
MSASKFTCKAYYVNDTPPYREITLQYDSLRISGTLLITFFFRNPLSEGNSISCSSYILFIFLRISVKLSINSSLVSTISSWSRYFSRSPAISTAREFKISYSSCEKELLEQDVNRKIVMVPIFL